METKVFAIWESFIMEIDMTFFMISEKTIKHLESN